ncbi:MAG TPA: amidohydrolase family protein, partial [Parafilimonas sp.]|nr:amidohydrolase family protein [Parafilimonas sp.]
MKELIKIHNGKLITSDKIVDDASVLVRSGTIVEVRETDIQNENAMEIDAKGNYISPGFIDMHVHGGGGCDFMDATESAFLTIAETHAKYGTTSLLPTTLSASKEDILKTLAVYEIANRNNINGAQFLGMHLEGPYLSSRQCGAQ